MPPLSPLHLGDTPPTGSPTTDAMQVLEATVGLIRVQRVDASGWPTFSPAWWRAEGDDSMHLVVDAHHAPWTSQLQNRPPLGYTLSLTVPQRSEVMAELALVAPREGVALGQGPSGAVALDVWSVPGSDHKLSPAWPVVHLLAPWVFLEPIVTSGDPIRWPGSRVDDDLAAVTGMPVECPRRAQYADDLWPYPGQPADRAWQFRKEQRLPMVAR